VKLSTPRRNLAKLAVLIHGKLAETRNVPPNCDLPEITWLRLRREFHRLRLAQRRGWPHAHRAQRWQVQISLETLRDEVQRVLAEIRIEPTNLLFSPQEIYRDLVALEEDFGAVTCSKKYQRLSVVTEPITLEGHYLGPFRIELSLRELLPHPFYSVSAEDPQPSSRNAEVPHPHVQGTQLCEGEGTMPIRAAVREGRLHDFFLIVASILRTYNPSSAYVGLDEWEGQRCRECDYAMHEDETRLCERCETTLCGECVRGCCDCSEPACSHCTRMCNACDEDVCRGCVKECRDCDQTFCSSCLQDDERCSSCHEPLPTQSGPQQPGPEILPARLGQADLLARSG